MKIEIEKEIKEIKEDISSIIDVLERLVKIANKTIPKLRKSKKNNL